MDATYRWCNDEYLAIELGDTVSVPLVVRGVALAQHLRNSPVARYLRDLSTSWGSVLVHFDAATITPWDFLDVVRAVVEETPVHGSVVASRQVTLPVCFGGKYGPDLEVVARANHLSCEETVRRLSGSPHLVGMISFSPGMANCMWLERAQALTAPKYATPRTYTPEGTVGLGGSSVALYSVPSPGGFQSVGRTPVPLYSPHPILPEFKQSPILLRTGDRLRFASVSQDEYDDILQEVREGRYRVVIEDGVLEEVESR